MATGVESQCRTNLDSDLLSKSVDDVTRDINGLKSAISALALSPQEAQKKSQQLDDILQLLSPLSNISKDVSEVSNTLQRWDVKWQGKILPAKIPWLLTIL
jgi:hypothetical protein